MILCRKMLWTQDAVLCKMIVTNDEKRKKGVCVWSGQ
jgi:hypothetical protein